MIRRPLIWLLAAALGLAAPVAAQSSLTLKDAVARARAQNPGAGGSAAAERAAEQRVTQARAGYMPKVDFVESWQRGNQPVFVFGSLLAQRQFTAANFAIDALNHPDAVNNFRAAFSVEQPIFDKSASAGVTTAGIGHEIATASRVAVDQDLAARVTNAFGRVLVSAAAQRAAAAAVETARADREMAGHRRDAGIATDADVLQIDVFVARAREQEIRALSEERIARAELNQLMGEPLDATFALDPVTTAPAVVPDSTAALETEAMENRPEVKLAALQSQLASASVTAARSAFLPQVSAQAGWEANGGVWHDRASSWIVGASVRINVFHGFSDKARLAEAREQETRQALQRKDVETSVRLDVHVARARLDAARASEAVGRAAVAQARESRRIIRDRYEAGLTDVVSLLGATEAVAQAEMQETSAHVAVLTETAALERALGRR